MIESDKILLAELAALLVAGRQLDEEQERTLARLFDKYPDGRSYLRNIVESGTIESPIDLRDINIYREWGEFQSRIAKPAYNPIRSRFNWVKYGVVAAVLVAVLVAGILWNGKDNEVAYIVADNTYGQRYDVLPNDKQARLEVAGEFVKDLDVDDFGRLPSSPDGRSLPYKISTAIRASFALELFDGSKVWLSPESEIEYLSGFSANERRIKVKGEVFFDVAKNAAKPFVVEVNGLEIKALGTAFSVRNYKESEPKVVLTEGRLQVKANGTETVIEAGYQVDLVGGKMYAAPSLQLDDALAIKDGLFNFINKDIETILEEINRWYGVSIEIDRTLEDKKYSGSIDRNVTLAKLCVVLKDLTGYQYIIEKDRLIVK